MTRYGPSARCRRSPSLHEGLAFSTMRIPALSREDWAWSGRASSAAAMPMRNELARDRMCISPSIKSGGIAALGHLYHFAHLADHLALEGPGRGAGNRRRRNALRVAR